MGRLLRKFPPRMIDPMYRAKTYIDKRRGMADPAAEDRRRRVNDRSTMPVAQIPPNQEVVLWGQATWNPASQVAGGAETTTVTVTGVTTTDGWVCVASFDRIPTSWLITANVTATDTCAVRIHNDSASTFDPVSSTVYCRCSKKA